MKYNDILFLSANEIIFLSFIDPPGWAIILHPLLFRILILSVKGKNPSEAHTNVSFLKYFILFLIANFNASTLFVWPCPKPNVCLFFDSTTAFDLRCLTTFNENNKSWICFDAPLFFETKLIKFWLIESKSDVWNRSPNKVDLCSVFLFLILVFLIRLNFFYS